MNHTKNLSNHQQKFGRSVQRIQEFRRKDLYSEIHLFLIFFVCFKAISLSGKETEYLVGCGALSLYPEEG